MNTDKSFTLDIQILDERIGNTIPMLEHATPGSAGVDLRACVLEDTIIKPGECILIPTGIAIHINDNEWATILLPRSGLGHKHGIILGNTVGLIDSDYTGQVYVSCWNRSDTPYTIAVGERIAQMVMIRVTPVTFNIIEKHDDTSRGDGGFGHSGRK